MAFILVPPRRWISGTKEPIAESLARFAAKNQVEILDLTRTFKEALKRYSIDELYIPNDHHWTPLGHSLVSERIQDFLQEKNLLTT